MSNAAKYRKKAAEFEQLKQIDRAIASYVKAIEESEAANEDVDVALFNKVGDLALRQGRVPDAITYYERAVEHYATSGLFNNAIALCNKILRNAPGRATVYFTLGRICARKGLRGDATRNFLEYATRMQQDGRVEEGMRALAEVADLMPELTEVRAIVEEHAARAGIALPRRRTPVRAAVAVEAPDGAADRSAAWEQRSSDLVFLDIDYGDPRSRTPLATPRMATPRGIPRVGGEARNTDDEGPVGQELPFLDATGRVEGLLDIPLELTGEGTDESAPATADAPASDAAQAGATGSSPAADAASIPAEPSLVRAPELGGIEVVALEGLEAHGGFEGGDVAPLEGFAPDAPAEGAEPAEPVPPSSDVTWLVPPEAEAGVTPLEDVLIEDITDPQGEEGVQAVIATETPSVVPAIPVIELDFLDVEPLVLEPFDDAPDAPDATTPSDVPFLDVPVANAPELEVVSFDLEPFDLDDPNEGAEGADGADGADGSAIGGRTGSAEDASSGVIPVVPLDITPVPELDAAIAAGAELVARAEAEEQAGNLTATRLPRASYHIDPHDFVQSGELPPLLLSDALVERGLQVAVAPAASAFETAASQVDALPETVASDMASPDMASPDVSVPEVPSPDATPSPEMVADIAFADMALADQTITDTPLPEAPLQAPLPDASSAPTRSPDAPLPQSPSADELEAEAALREAVGERAALLDLDDVDLAPEESNDVSADREPSAPRSVSQEPARSESAGPEEELSSALSPRPTPRSVEVVHVTPSLPTAAVAAEAVVVATSRRDALRAAVARLPQHWLLRRRLAEALFEAGERDAALHELETAQQGLMSEGELQAAAEIADELVHVSPDRVAYHQRRVELAVRLQEQDRLQLAYLDLADALVRMGEEGRARAVYARVLELDPYDDRARAALGAAAPPPPPPPRPDDQFVDLADWLRDDDEPASTRMRMREPVISGDEQADFDALLQHFKEGVSRSLGENDFAGHYDLGVAYKEMGLLDDAIAEFQKALRSRTHRLPAYEALGQCFVEQGRHQIAATVLSRALHEPGLDDEQRVGVLYLLAHSCEALQRTDEARGYFQRVYATDIHFRDVAARLAALDHATR